MAGIVNPLSSLGGFQNQKLARFTQPQQTSAMSAAQAPMDDGPVMPTSDGFGEISDQATRQHTMFLAALRAQQARQRSRQSSGYSGGSSGPSGPMAGRYNLIAGADQALSAMNAAFRQQFGYDMKIASGGRSYAEQKRLYEGYKKGLPGYNLAAPPGKSVHNSGRAVDFGGALHNAGSREHNWLVANANRWGFKWTGKNFKQFEPWHFEWWG